MIGRERELEELGAVAALRTVENEHGERIYEEPAPLVVVYGGASTGKSMCVAQALRRHADIYALVDCTAIYSAQEFYREILVQLYKNQNHSAHGTSSLAVAEGTATGADEVAAGVEPDEQLTIEDEQEITNAAQAGAKKTSGGGGDGSDAPSHSGEESESESSDSGETVQDEKDAWQSRKQSAISRAKREREQQREQQQQRDAEARESRVTYEGYNSLNFLSFIKALGIFMNVATKQQPNDEADEETENGCRKQQRKRVVYLALDQVDKLLDRGLAPLLTCIFTVNDQLAYLNVSVHSMNLIQSHGLPSRSY